MSISFSQSHSVAPPFWLGLVPLGVCVHQLKRTTGCFQLGNGWWSPFLSIVSSALYFFFLSKGDLCAAHSGFSLGPRGSSCPLASPSGLPKQVTNQLPSATVQITSGARHCQSAHTSRHWDDRHFQCFSGFFDRLSWQWFILLCVFLIGSIFTDESVAHKRKAASNRRLHKLSAMMTLMPYLESGSTIPSSAASRLDLDDDQLIDNSHRQVTWIAVSTILMQLFGEGGGKLRDQGRKKSTISCGVFTNNERRKITSLKPRVKD